MKKSDIETIASALADARPGSYPSGGPDTDDGWKMWHAVCYTMAQQLARRTANWRAAEWDALCGQERK